MTPIAIQHRAWRHNYFQIFLGVIALLASLLLWLFSFWFVRWCISLPLDIFDFDGNRIGSYVAWVGILILVGEGVRYAGPRLWRRDYQESDDYDNFLTPNDGSVLNLNVMAAGVGSASVILSQVLRAAPRTTVDGIIAFLSRVPSDEHTVAEAARILGELKGHRRWVAADDFARSAAALRLLERLDLIWVERNGDFAEIRYPAGVR